MLSILYIGNAEKTTTAYHRAAALGRLGHHVSIHTPHLTGVHRSKILSRLHYRTGYTLVQRSMLKQLRCAFSTRDRIDLIWVNSGEMLGRQCLRHLRTAKCPIVLYNNDDATGSRDGNRFRTLRRALPHYDLCAVLRHVNVGEYLSHGARRVARVWMSYDEVEHSPHASGDAPNEDVLFIGTRIPGESREEFIHELLSRGLNVGIRGSRWRGRCSTTVEKAIRSDAVTGRAYVNAIRNAKLSLGFISKGNRDLHTRRSVEVPYAGGLLCAERTGEHMGLYRENEEALLWTTPEECFHACQWLLSDETARKRIRDAGMRRIRALGLGNQDVCGAIIEAALDLDGPKAQYINPPLYS